MTWESWLKSSEKHASKGGKEAGNSRKFDAKQAAFYMLLAANAKLAKVVAVMYPEKQQGKKIDLATKLGSSSEYLRKARTVLEFTPAAADLVLSGGSSLNDAYQEALNEKIDKARAGEDIEHLQREAPD